MPAPFCIGIFSALYLPNMGGVETYTANLARTLAQENIRVIIVTLNTHNLESVTENDGITIVRLPCRNLLNGRYPIAKRNADYQHLYAWLKKQHIDSLIVNTRFYLHSYEGLAFGHNNSITTLLIEHGSAHVTLGNPVFDAGIRLIEHGITAAERRFKANYYAVSRKASTWLNHFNIKSCGEFSNAIDADAYVKSASIRNFRQELGLPDSTLMIAFVGRLVREKGILELAQAAKQWNLPTSIAVLAAGSGPLEGQLHSFENSRFRLLGKLKSNDVAALLLQADALILPSRSEGFATILLEAAACATPVITTNVGGVDELIPTKDYGTILPDRTSQSILQALEAAAENRPHIKQQGRNAANLVRSQYSWTHTAKRIINACKQDG